VCGFSGFDGPCETKGKFFSLKKRRHIFNFVQFSTVFWNIGILLPVVLILIGMCLIAFWLLMPWFVVKHRTFSCYLMINSSFGDLVGNSEPYSMINGGFFRGKIWNWLKWYHHNLRWALFVLKCYSTFAVCSKFHVKWKKAIDLYIFCSLRNCGISFTLSLA
jgi:hypothetical protein